MGKAAVKVKKRKIFEIAKELNVDSKAIVEKCRAEEIPDIKDHMSSVSVGLEATIREWFSAGEHKTTIETAAKVDVEAVKAPAKKKAAKAPATPAAASADAPASTPADSAAPVVAAPMPTPAPAVAPPPATPVPPQAPSVTESKPPSPVTPSQVLGKAHRAVKAAPPEAPLRSAPAPSAPTVVEPPKPVPASRPHAPAAPQPPSHPVTPHARIEPPKPRVYSLSSTTSSPAKPGGPGERVVDPPPMGLVRIQEAPPPTPPTPGTGGPTRRGDRPTTPLPGTPRPRPAAAPVKIDVQTPAKLSGPKVVRIEQPDVVEAPRSRSDGGGFPRGPRPGGGAGVGEEEGGPKRRVAGPGARRPGSGNVPANRTSRRSGRSDLDTSTAGFSEQDLIEREARLNRSGGFLRQRRHDAKVKEQHHTHAATPMQTGGVVKIAKPFTIKDLSAATGVKSADIVKKLFLKGVMANPNQAIEDDQALEIMLDWNIELEFVESKTGEQLVAEEFAGRDSEDIRSRAPVVTILGHVDHGKTSLLDKIRNTNIAEGEAGGITQSTRAFRTAVNVENQEKFVCFFDTPGHQAFSEMRARGANMTDMVVLVVSVVDGVMPQTIESINHAKAAKVPIIVALNKIDMPGVNDAMINKVYGQLAEHGLNPTAWGGDTDVVHTSATKGTGIQELLETIDYRAQILDLKAGFKGPARGMVIEAKMEEGRGPVANILVQDGELKVGDILVAGKAYGRVRDITNDRGEKVKSASPSTPVQVSGLAEIPNAGDKLYVVESLRKASEVAEQRAQAERMKELATPKVTLDSMFAQLKEGDTLELRVVLKADVQGSVDVISRSIEEVSTEKVKVRVLHAAVGGINESDVTLAAASQAIIVGFNVIPSGKARSQAEAKRVEIRTYDVIYNIVDDMKLAAEGLLAPVLRQEVLGHAEVRQVFKVSKVGAVAGCYVTDGSIERNALIRVTRNGIVIEKDRTLEQLKRFKDDAKEVKAGLECGMKIVGYDDIKEGDVLECYKNVEEKQKL